MAQMVRNLPAICRRRKRLTFDSWVGKIPWRRDRLPTPGFLPGEFHGQRSLAGCSPWVCKESDTAERLTLSLFSYLQIQEPREFQEAQTECQARHRIIRLLKTEGQKTLKAARFKGTRIVSVLLLLRWMVLALNNSTKHSCVVCRSLCQRPSTHLTWLKSRCCYLRTCLRLCMDLSPCSLVVLTEFRSYAGGPRPFCWLSDADLCPHQGHLHSEARGRSAASKAAVGVQSSLRL